MVHLWGELLASGSWMSEGQRSAAEIARSIDGGRAEHLVLIAILTENTGADFPSRQD